MTNLTLILLGLILLAQPCAVYSQSKKPASIDKRQSSGMLTARQVADKALRSVVLIVTTDEKGNPVGQGSGFVFRPGLVVTNLHVFTRATKAVVKSIANGKTYTAIEVLGMSLKHDLCVIRINDHSIHPVSLARTEKPQIGDEVYVASNPEGLEGSITKGIISSIRSEAGLLQIDAAISSGSSGGAVVNQRAEVVGIVKSSLVEGQNLNFAIPVEYLRSLPLKYTLPIVVAGACAYRDRDHEKLKGLVKSVLDEERSSQRETRQHMMVFDIDGNRVEYHIYKPDGESAKLLITYDENGFKTQVEVSTRKFTFGAVDESGFKTQVNLGVSKVNGTTMFTFGESVEGKINHRQFSSIEVSSGDPRTYDNQGNMVEWIFRKKETREVYTYEPDGRVKEKFVYIRNAIAIKYRFSYRDDEYGNWTEMREFVFYPGKPDLGWSEGDITVRKITYFQ